MKLYSFVLAAIVTALAGAIFYVRVAAIEPLSVFDIRWTMYAIVGVVVGGLRIESGPIAGTLIVTVLYFLLARLVGISLLAMGVILIIVMLVAPQGIVGAIRDSRAVRSLVGAATSM